MNFNKFSFYQLFEVWKKRKEFGMEWKIAATELLKLGLWTESLISSTSHSDFINAFYPSKKPYEGWKKMHAEMNQIDFSRWRHSQVSPMEFILGLPKKALFSVFLLSTHFKRSTQESRGNNIPVAESLFSIDLHLLEVFSVEWVENCHFTLHIRSLPRDTEPSNRRWQIWKYFHRENR